MFTGIVEATGEVVEVRLMPAGVRLRVATRLASDLAVGDSIAVDGVCLTVVLCGAGEFHAEVSPETTRVTALSATTRGSIVNLERPLAADGRLGGHFVLGHVDGVGHIDEIRQDGEFWWVTFRYPAGLELYLVRRGSVAVDGISLTVAGLSAQRFDVQVVPHTWHHTKLHASAVDDPVNVECDIIGKYIVRALEVGRGDAGDSEP